MVAFMPPAESTGFISLLQILGNPAKAGENFQQLQDATDVFNKAKADAEAEKIAVQNAKTELLALSAQVRDEQIQLSAAKAELATLKDKELQVNLREREHEKTVQDFEAHVADAQHQLDTREASVARREAVIDQNISRSDEARKASEDAQRLMNEKLNQLQSVWSK